MALRGDLEKFSEKWVEIFDFIVETKNSVLLPMMDYYQYEFAPEVNYMMDYYVDEDPTYNKELLEDFIDDLYVVDRKMNKVRDLYSEVIRMLNQLEDDMWELMRSEEFGVATRMREEFYTHWQGVLNDCENKLQGLHQLVVIIKERLGWHIAAMDKGELPYEEGYESALIDFMTDLYGDKYDSFLARVDRSIEKINWLREDFMPDLF